MSKEIFKIFKDTRKDGHNGALWEVSNFGNVRKNGKEYIPYETNSGYLRFGHYLVHRAVAELFLEGIDSKPTVDHKDRDKHNNMFWNLRWATPKEQAANRDNESISKSMIGNKKSLGRIPSEETRAKLRAAALGRKLSKETKEKISAANLGHRHSEETKAKNRASHLGRKHSEETKAKISVAISVANIGNKNVRGKVWVFNPSTEHSARVNPSELNDYIAKGYIRGNKNASGKVWVFNPSTEHSTTIKPSQLTDYIAKGYIKGRKSKK